MYVLVIVEIIIDLFVNEVDFVGWLIMFLCFIIFYLWLLVGWYVWYINICNMGFWEYVNVLDVCLKLIG